MDLPPHPEADDDAGPAGVTARRLATAIVVALVAAAFAALVIFHVTGVVGPAGH